MDITIIGTGNMGRAIATRALAGGHTVTLLGTDKAKAEAVAAELSGDVRAGAVGDPLTGDVVVLAVWYQALGDVLARYGDQLDGKLVQGEVAGQPLDVLVAADDEEAKRTVSRLAEDAGLRAVDAGPLARAQQLEGLGYLHMAIQDSLG